MSGGEDTSAGPSQGRGTGAARPNNWKPLVDDARQKIESGLWTVREVKGTSAAWKMFGKVFSANDTYQEFVQCFKCKHIKVHKKSYGTGALNDHQCTFRSKDDDQTKVLLTPEMRKKFIDACVDFCAGDLRPFCTVSGENFEKLIQAALDIGKAVTDPVEASQLIPDRTTVSRHVQARADKCRAQVIPKILKALEAGTCSFTTDMWTDRFSQAHFMTVTAHCVIDSKIENYVLLTTEFCSGPATAENVLDELLLQFSALEISPDLLRRAKFVSDNGSNIKKALEDFQRIYCQCHLYNIVLKSTFDVKLFKVDLLGTTGGAIVNAVGKAVFELKLCRTVAKAFKNSLIFVNLNPTNRYKSALPMLVSVEKHWIKKMNKPLSEILKDVNRSDLVDVISFLRLVERFSSKTGSIATMKIYEEKFVNDIFVEREDDSPLLSDLRLNLKSELAVLDALHQVERCKSLVTYMKKSGLVNELQDGESLKQQIDPRWNTTNLMLKSIVHSFDKVTGILKEKNQQHRLDGISLQKVESLIEFLEPFEKETKRLETGSTPTIHLAYLSYNKLKKHCLPKEIDCTMMRKVRSVALALLESKFIPSMVYKIALFLHPEYRHLLMLTDVDRNEVLTEVRKLCSDVILEAQEEPPLAKRAKDDDFGDEFMEWRDPVCISVDEVQSYISFAAFTSGTPILDWWKANAHLYPKLDKVAQQILCVPASSAGSERVFSVAGFILNALRQRLSPEQVNNLLFLFFNTKV